MPHIAGFRGIVAATERDASRAVYRYHQLFNGGGRTFTRKSFACAVRLADWSEGSIRGHEDVTDAGRDAHLAKIRAGKLQTEAFVAGVRDTAGEVERLFRGVEMGRPTLEKTTPDGTVHKLWRAASAELIGKLRTYFTPKKLHILEGHDVYAAMLAYRDEQTKAGDLSMYSSANYGLSYIVTMDDSGLVPAPLHHVFKGLELKSDAVLAAAKQYFIVEKLPGAAAKVDDIFKPLGATVAHQPAFVVVFGGEPDAWKLTLSPDVSPYNEGVKTDRALQKYDPIVLEHMFVARHLAGGTRTTERDAKAALAAVTGEGGKGSVALFTRPLSIEQVAHVDELGHRLPAHSTALFPEIAQGLVSFPIDRDEDVQ
ncbi:MAG TPA: DUF1015 family protein [Kofleriaceae bacterium]|jgi:uncharacterized protein (DUF1015 family)